MGELELSALDWQLRGWRPFQWHLDKAAETAGGGKAEVGPVPARVPGSVQQALREAGILPDWHVGLNSRACEWVEHRHWDFTAAVPAGLAARGQRLVLEADGLDYSGWVLIDDRQVAPFAGALRPHRFDLTGRLDDGQPHRLSLVFAEPPREQGQFGYTSRSRHFKPRYPYSWDWCPRVVPIGAWEGLRLRWGLAAAVEVASLRTFLAEDLRGGRVEAELDGDEPPTGARCSLVVRDGPRVLGRAEAALAAGRTRLAVEDLGVEPWWPNGHGPPRTYSVQIEASAGEQTWRRQRLVGFRRIDWVPCADAPADAEPWLCRVNGRAVFLQGANWVPPRVCYHDATPDEYRRLVELYRDMGCTVLRVWGGGILERECFYELCDQAGILVWQEFPLSSSGVDNWPPVDPEPIAAVTAIAASYIQRRAHHPSLLLWCGGNELLGGGLAGQGQPGVPVGYDHPCIAALRRVVETADPGRRFLPTSASGPYEWGTPDRFGTGTLHDVHGPWGFGPGCADLDEWRQYWAADDALFRSEVGMPGAQSVALLQQYGAGEQLWPPTTAYWRHTCSWWTQWARLRPRLEHLPPAVALAEYVRLTQAEQAEAYASAAAACKARFPRCGGFLVWMGHDCFPCPANNAVIDFARQPKPAYQALRRVFCGP